MNNFLTEIKREHAWIFKDLPLKKKKSKLKKKAYGIAGAFYTISGRLRSFIVLICHPSQLNVPPSLVFPVYSHNWVGHMDSCAPTSFLF